MVIFNIKDFNLPAIQKESGLDEEWTETSYRVHGLKEFPGRDYEILVRYNVYRHNHPTVVNFGEIQKLFLSNGIKMVSDKEYFDGNGNHNIYIGLIKSFRTDVTYCAKVLKTLVFAMENKIKINQNFRFKKGN